MFSWIGVTCSWTWRRWSKTGGYITEKRKLQDFPTDSKSVIHLSPSAVWCSLFFAQSKSCTKKMALNLSEHTWKELLHHISSAKNLLRACCPKEQPLSHVRVYLKQMMLGCAPDLWSLGALLKLMWFHLGAQTPIWSNLRACTLRPLPHLTPSHFNSCGGPSALKPEWDFKGGLRLCPESLTSLPASWNDALQLPRLLRLPLPKYWDHDWNIWGEV